MDKGVIWAFAGPVILIILVSLQFHLPLVRFIDSVLSFPLQVNTILLIVTVISIVRVRRKASGKDNTQTNVIMYEQQ